MYNKLEKMILSQKSKRSFLVCFLFLTGLALLAQSCNNDKQNSVLRIAAASNLRYALEEINTEFEKGNGIKVEMSAASSGKLTAQIQNGAPFDVFLSANKKYPQYLYDKGFGQCEPRLFCYGLLVYWAIKDLKLKSDMRKITGAGIHKIAIANPKNAPFGIAAVEALKSISAYGRIKNKVVFAENVSQISQYVLNNNVDVGFTGKSIVLSPKLKNKGKWFDVDEDLYHPIGQYVLLLKNNKTDNNAQKYIDYLNSPQAQKVFMRYGYKTPPS